MLTKQHTTGPDAAQQARIAAKAAHLQDTLARLRGQLATQQAVKSAPPPVEDLIPDFQRNPDRPQSLNEVVGQEEITCQLRLVIAGSLMRGVKVPHILISGPAGCGKTSLSEIIAEEADAAFIPTTGMILKKVEDVIGLMVKTAGRRTVVFIDEVHAMNKAAQECLYTILEDAKVDILGGQGADTVASTQYLPDLIIVAATTNPGALTVPFRDRFGAQFVMADYTDAELAEIVTRYWKSKGMKCFKGEAMAVAKRSKGVPRRAMMLATRVLDWAAINEQPAIISGTVDAAMGVFNIDPNGLDKTDRKILHALTHDYVGKTVGLIPLAAFLSMDPVTLEQQYEGHLVRAGLMLKTGRGRTASTKAYDLMRESS